MNEEGQLQPYCFKFHVFFLCSVMMSALGFSVFNITVAQKKALEVTKSSVCNPGANTVLSFCPTSFPASLLAISRETTEFIIQVIIHSIVK